MLINKTFLLAFYVLLFSFFPSLSIAETKSEGSLSALKEGVRKFTLSNGVRVIMFHRDAAPVFSGNVFVKVGGVNELPGKTGIAHMLEHMAFKGSTTIGTKDYQREKNLLEQLEQLVAQGVPAEAEERKKIQQELESLWEENEFSKIYSRLGATGLNAGTSKDYTVYTVQLPTSAFEVWCWMESDRIIDPVFRGFYKERNVVMEERRLRTDDSPGGKMYEAMLATAFRSHPNRLPVIGWRSDIQSLTASETLKFHDQYYYAENIVLALVGDLEVEAARPLLEKYFGRIRQGVGDVPPINTVEDPQEGERIVEVVHDAEPMLLMAYHKPAYPNPDDMYLAVVHSLLSEGRTSILYRELVEEKRLALHVSTSEAPGSQFPSVFYVSALPAPGVSVQTLRDEVQRILDRLKTTPIEAKKIQAAKRRVRVDYLDGLRSNAGLAGTLGQTELLWGDWRELIKMYELIEQTTAEHIRDIAQSYFNVENRTLVYLVPADKRTPN